MATILPVIGIDPALCNIGLARLLVDIEPRRPEIVRLERIKLVTTEKTTAPIRGNSDDLARAQRLFRECLDFCDGAAAVCAEIPGGSKDNRSSRTGGIMIGLLAAISVSLVPIVEVTALEAKEAATGNRHATKSTMVDWAYANWPEADWITSARSKRANRLTDANEHVADACAAAVAGLASAQFQQCMSLWRAAFLARSA